jgi:hypothetical protein
MNSRTSIFRLSGRQAFSALLYGMAHAFDLGGTLARSRGRFASGPQADAEALRQDWLRAANAVGRDGRAHA